MAQKAYQTTAAPYATSGGTPARRACQNPGRSPDGLHGTVVAAAGAAGVGPELDPQHAVAGRGHREGSRAAELADTADIEVVGGAQVGGMQTEAAARHLQPLAERRTQLVATEVVGRVGARVARRLDVSLAVGRERVPVAAE